MCDHNEKHGHPRNHPDAPKRPKIKSSRTSLPVAPCSILGEPLTGTEREARGLDHRRDWRWCGHKDRPLGEAVCRCMGCGPACPGYSTS